MTPGPVFRVLILVAGLALLGAGPACSRGPQGQAVPPLTLQTLDDTEITLGGSHLAPTLVVFFALNNPLALTEITRLEALTNDYAGLELVAVALSSERPELVRTVFHRQGSLVTVAMDPLGAAAEAFGDVAATPTVMLLSTTGRILFSSEGTTDMTALRATIDAL